LYLQFSVGADLIWIFEVPDENSRFYQGWVFLFNTSPYFYSIAGGSEMLETYLCDAYARYLAENQEFDCLEKAMGEEDVWLLNDDCSIEFDIEFSAAMRDAGYVLNESGAWGRAYAGEEEVLL